MSFCSPDHSVFPHGAHNIHKCVTLCVYKANQLCTVLHHSSIVAFRGFAIGTLIYLTVKSPFNTILYFGKRKGCSFSVYGLLIFLWLKKNYTKLFSLDTISNPLSLYLNNLEEKYQNLLSFLEVFRYKIFASDKTFIIIITPFCIVVISFLQQKPVKALKR